MLLTAGILTTIGALLGVVLTLLTLPGIWLMLLVAMLCTWWQPDLYSLWTLAAVAIIALGAEIAEGLSSAAGSAKTGGSKAGIAGALVGSLVGLVAGTVFLVFIPLIGSIIGAVVGAGGGAVIAERGIAKRPWGESFRSGKGAAVGRALSTIIKGGFAVVAALVLIVGAFVN